MDLNYKKYFLLLFSGILIISGCQRDDICPESTETTPLLIISFFDFAEPDRPRSPNNLTITHTERDSILYYRISADSIALPLKTTRDLTQYAFTRNAPDLNAGDDEPGPLVPETDTITFSYARDEIYVNRACAFKVNYIDLKTTLEEGENGGWIENIVIEQTEVEDETQRHISIFY